MGWSGWFFSENGEYTYYTLVDPDRFGDGVQTLTNDATSPLQYRHDAINLGVG